MQTTYPENYTKQLQRLFVLVSDNQKHYQQAAEKVQNPEFKELFHHFSLEREAIINELRKRIVSSGVSPQKDEHGFMADLQRSWQDFKASVSGSGDQAVLESCRNSDQTVLDGYDDVLQGSVLEDAELKFFLSAQRYTINESFLELDRRYFDLFNSDNSADYL